MTTTATASQSFIPTPAEYEATRKPPAPTALTFRKAKATGDWVVYGPAADVVAGFPHAVRKANGDVKTVYVGRVGKPFVVNGTSMIYGYVEVERQGRYYVAPTRRTKSSCPTDGNCSSFGSGRTCGADDCDGWG
jgi:hypothetical protein